MSRITQWAAGLGAILAPVMAEAATFNNNNLYDIFTVNTGGSVSWFESTGTPNQVASLGSFSISSNAVGVTAGLLNGNGQGDILIGRTTTTTWLESDGTAGSGVNAVSGLAFGSRDDLTMGDLDGDGLNELWTVSSTSNLSWFEYSGTGDTLNTVNSTVLSGGITTAIGDLDGNGLMDVLVGREDRLSWIETTGDDAIGSRISFFGAGVSGFQSLAMGDFDGNGVTDLFAVNPNGIVKWYEYTGGTSISLVTTFDSDASAVAMADLDGSGVQTLLIGHTSSAVTWWQYDADTDMPVDIGGTAFATSGVQDIAIFPIPEPASLGLLGIGSLAMLRRR